MRMWFKSDIWGMGGEVEALVSRASGFQQGPPAYGWRELNSCQRYIQWAFNLLSPCLEGCSSAWNRASCQTSGCPKFILVPVAKWIFGGNWDKFWGILGLRNNMTLTNVFPTKIMPKKKKTIFLISSWKMSTFSFKENNSQF